MNRFKRMRGLELLRRATELLEEAGVTRPTIEMIDLLERLAAALRIDLGLAS